MAKQTIVTCDICDEPCKIGGRYLLIYKSFFIKYGKRDICYECAKRIGEEVRENRRKKKLTSSK